MGMTKAHAACLQKAQPCFGACKNLSSGRQWEALEVGGAERTAALGDASQQGRLPRRSCCSCSGSDA